MISPISETQSKSMVASALNSGPVVVPTFTGPVSGSSKVSSLGQLREISKELYNKVLFGLALKVCHEQERANARLKKMRRENQSN